MLPVALHQSLRVGSPGHRRYCMAERRQGQRRHRASGSAADPVPARPRGRLSKATLAYRAHPRYATGSGPHMTQVDFYILPSADPAARLDFACKLTEKAWRLGHKVYLHCSDAAQRKDLDARLWRFKGEVFLPHGDAESDHDAPVVLGLGADPGAHDDLLVNLDLSIPAFFSRFARVAEVVVEDPAIRLAARESFRSYREQGYPPQDHRLQRL
ncbi:DNA polymerase III subunit chi [Pseudomonas cannabina]|uniref:DNA polymerase III subunit chi n=2 Tax=Pseudomonas cannabina TaxID=86840 RepID=A0A3M3K766_PSECA|nr:DNA polymerase III subunit chi [Pseudomonas cannabina]